MKAMGNVNHGHCRGLDLIAEIEIYAIDIVNMLYNICLKYVKIVKEKP
jgi:hypothetical protein